MQKPMAPSFPAETFSCAVSQSSPARQSASKSATGVFPASAIPRSRPRVVERNSQPGRLHAVIDFRGGHRKSITRQPRARAQHRSRQLENIRVAPRSPDTSRHSRRGHKRPHRPAGRWNVHVVRLNDHAALPFQGGREGRAYHRGHSSGFALGPVATASAMLYATGRCAGRAGPVVDDALDRGVFNSTSSASGNWRNTR